jgi:hypothetical protein
MVWNGPFKVKEVDKKKALTVTKSGEIMLEILVAMA